MEQILQRIKEYLDSDAEIKYVEGRTEVFDIRFESIKQIVDSVEQKDTEFYTKLVKLISDCIDKLYKKEKFNIPVWMPADAGALQYEYYLKKANHDFAKKLFDYVCGILEQNEDIKLDADTLKKLLNRGPKRLEFVVGDNYIYRPLNFNGLVEIINRNELIKKSGISIDGVYQILIDTCQIANEQIFVGLITPEDFKKENKRVKKLLKECPAKIFVVITDIILRQLDKEFDVIAIVKERVTSQREKLTPDGQMINKNFAELLICNLLLISVCDKGHDIVQQLLNDPEISINYNFRYNDYSGTVSLKALLAHSKDRTIVKKLLSASENIENVYLHNDFVMRLYSLYAITGDYEKAISTFAENYNFADDFNEDFSNGFNDEGYARADFEYEDSLVQFIIHICNSFEKDGIEYSKRKDIINRILNNGKVRHINILDVLSEVKRVLLEEDFKSLLDSLIEKYNAGSLEFITVDVERGGGLTDCYNIRIASESEIEKSLADLNGGSYKLIKRKPVNPTGIIN